MTATPTTSVQFLPPFDLAPFLPGPSGAADPVVIEYRLTGSPVGDMEAFQVIEGQAIVAILTEPPTEPEACITMPYRSYLDLRMGRRSEVEVLASARVQGDIAVLSFLGGVLATPHTRALWGRNRSLVTDVAQRIDAVSLPTTDRPRHPEGQRPR